MTYPSQTPTVGRIEIVAEKTKPVKVEPRLRVLLLTIRSACIMIAKGIEAYLDC